MRRVSRWLALDRRSGRVAGLPTVEVVAAEDYDREVNDLRDQVQMYEEKAERDWRDFGEMQDARIAADDRVVELEKELARVCKQLDSANDMVERAWSLTAGAMSGNPHRPTANTEWMDAAHAWEHDYCMGQGSSVPEYPTVSYRVRDRDSDYKAMCHEDRDHAELLLKAWLADGRDAVIERRHVFDGGWSVVERPFFTEQQERALARCEGYDEARAASPDERLREAAAWLVELAAAAVCEPRRFAENETELQWKTADAITATRAALAAADREAPDDGTHAPHGEGPAHEHGDPQ